MEMAFYFLITYVLISAFVLNDSTNVHSVKNNSTFTPSHQWQKVEEGQAIPPGLHVRVNLRTKEKEAKLLDSENSNNNKKSLIVTEGENEETEDSSKIDFDKLKHVLKNIKPDDAAKENVNKNFRSYKELKEDFSKLHIQMKTDIEILSSLIENFRKFNIVKSKSSNNKSADWTEDEDILTVLVDLEYLVHQFDNAQEFAKLNGFSDVIYVSLNSSNSEIRSEALRLLGSATQSNPTVQIAALDSGSINLLLKILTFDEDVNVRSRSLFALSCLIRRFPAAQLKLIKDGGLTAFAKVFDEEKQDLVKLQVKIITLIHDLLFERKDTKMNILEEESKNLTNSRIESLKERLQQYENMDLEKKLVEQEWCKRISNWFIKQNPIKELNKNLDSSISLENINLDSHDVIEKVVDTLYVLSDICKSQFQSNTDLVNLLYTLRNVYNELALAESRRDDLDDTNQFYVSLSNILKMLTDKLKVTIKKDEL